MAWRGYFTTCLGAGTPADPFRGRVTLAGAITVDARASSTVQAGEMFVVVNVTPAEHTTLLGTAGVTYLNLEDLAGTPVPPAGTLGDVSAANRTAARTMLDARHIPYDDLTAQDTVRMLWRRIAMRCVVRQILGANDYTEGLDTLVSAIPAAKRQAIRAALEARGFNVDGAGILGTDTVRQALIKTIIATGSPRALRVAGV